MAPAFAAVRPAADTTAAVPVCSPPLAHAAATLVELERRFHAAPGDDESNRLGAEMEQVALHLARMPAFGIEDALLKLHALTRRLRQDLSPEDTARVTDYLLVESALAALSQPNPA